MSSQIDKTGTKKDDDGRSSPQPGDRQPVVNTEEQNKPVNPAGADYNESATAGETTVNNSNNTPGQTNPDGDSAVDKSDRLEGEEKETNERRLPKL
jgi:hypothetical protein